MVLEIKYIMALTICQRTQNTDNGVQPNFICELKHAVVHKAHAIFLIPLFNHFLLAAYHVPFVIEISGSGAQQRQVTPSPVVYRPSSISIVQPIARCCTNPTGLSSFGKMLIMSRLVPHQEGQSCLSHEDLT